MWQGGLLSSKGGIVKCLRLYVIGGCHRERRDVVRRCWLTAYFHHMGQTLIGSSNFVELHAYAVTQKNETDPIVMHSHRFPSGPCQPRPFAIWFKAKLYSFLCGCGWELLSFLFLSVLMFQREDYFSELRVWIVIAMASEPHFFLDGSRWVGHSQYSHIRWSDSCCQDNFSCCNWYSRRLL